ncbi:MAG: hypothetical protein V1887_04495 [Candidatus Aenigmatarchaeota archaeon]
MEIITYESIRSAHRAEKNEQLAKLHEGFWPAVHSWISSKEGRKDSTSLLEADSAKKLIEDIVQRRQRKTVIAALATARGAAPPQGLTVEEAKFFDQLVTTIKMSGRSAMEAALGADALVREKIEEAKRCMDEMKPQPAINHDFPTAEIKEGTVSGISPSFDGALKAPVRKVKLLSALPAVVGLDRQTYGPFDAGAIAELPPDIVAILAARGAAETI